MAITENGHVGELVSLAGVPGKVFLGRELVYASYVPITTTTSQVLFNNPKRIAALIVNSGSTDIAIRLGTTPVIGPPIQGMLLSPGGSLQIDKDLPWTGEVFVVFGASGGSLEVEEISVP